jgi:hypothetical protein
MLSNDCIPKESNEQKESNAEGLKEYNVQKKKFLIETAELNILLHSQIIDGRLSCLDRRPV